MADNKEIADRLESRLNNLVKTQIDFQKEIMQIRAELAALRGTDVPTPVQPTPAVQPPPVRPANRQYIPPAGYVAQPEEQAPTGQPNIETPGGTSSTPPPSPPPAAQQQPRPRPPVNREPPPRRETGGEQRYRPTEAPNFGRYSSEQSSARAETRPAAAPKQRSDLEKFVGENLLSKIGIIILIIGVAIGAKYAIDRGWITPFMRVAFGYAIGLVLVGLAVKLKAKYLNFSAVLLGGGMAVMYFITYFAYGIYELIPQSAAFALMVMFTVFTVTAAILYSRQSIAHFGLVGAYAVPFLLSNNSGRFAFLFTYIAVINVGILAISIVKYWKPLVYTSFIFTWATFFGWYLTKYNAEAHLYLGLLFLGIFFAIFYLTTIIQHRLFAERTAADDLVITLLNTVIFYGFSLSMILLREDSFGMLLSYVAAFTGAILILSISDYRRPLLFASFFGCWIIYLSWFSAKYFSGDYFYLGLIFLGIFFSIFYLTTIIEHRFMGGETGAGELFLTMANAAAFYGFSLAMVNARLDNFAPLFAYIAAFTAGIVIISIRDYRRPLLYASFIGSWLIYFIWYMTKYRADEHFSLAAAFLVVFFAIFYITGLVHSNMFKEKAIVENTAPLLTNSFVFFSLGFVLLHRRPEFAPYMGLYSIGHAGLHFFVSNVTSRVKSFPVEITYLLTALVITFITIAIPVQFDGHVITLVWAVEGAILFWFGRVRQIRLFEYFAYPLMLLATGSLIVDWFNAVNLRSAYEVKAFEYPVFNGNFLTALVYVAAFAFIYYINRDVRYEPAIPEHNRREIGILIAILGIGALYNAFRIEIDNYFHFLSVRTMIPIAAGREAGFKTDGDLDRFNYIWQINYTMLFLSLVSLINIGKVRSKLLGYTNLLFNAGLVGIFATIGIFLLMQLRENYIDQSEAEFFARTPFHIAIRYICYGFLAALFFLTFRYTKRAFLRESVSARFMELGFDLIFYLPLWIIASSELINLMDIFGYADSYKLGMSILWGVYALFLVSIGIYFNKKHLRVGAIVLFAFTLVKLFFYDIASLSTIAKTAVFVSLGVLMLIVSFLYNKYKALIVGYNETPPGK